MREQYAPRAIANGVDGRIAGLLFFVDLDEALIVAADSRAFQAKVVTIGNAPDRHQDPVIEFLLLVAVRFDDHLDLFTLRLHLRHPALEAHFLERLLRGGHYRP